MMPAGRRVMVRGTSHFPTLPFRREPAGVLLNGTLQQGVAVTLRLIRHPGATIELASDDHCRLTFPHPGWARWMAWYSPEVAANGRQPDEQIQPAAYMPIGYAAFERLELPGAGVLLRQDSDTPIQGLVLTSGIAVMTQTEAGVVAHVRRVLSNGGVSDEYLDAAVAFLLAPQRSRSTSAA